MEKQKQLALEVLHLLEATDPCCILAGGAPRDWWLGKKANDLDFYVYWGHTTTCHEDKRRLDRIGLEGYREMTRNTLSDLYGSIPELRRVWEVDYHGEKVQIMVMGSPTFNCVVDRFGVSTSKIWWKGKNLHPTEDFIISHLTKNLFIKDNYNAGETYVKKMKERYPLYAVRPYTAMTAVGVDLAIRLKLPWWKILNLGDKQTQKGLTEVLGLGV